MRRLIASLFALLLALQPAGAWAGAAGDCCDGCADLALCVTVACKACPALALLPAAPRLFAPAAAAPAWCDGGTCLDAARVEIWRPPR